MRKQVGEGPAQEVRAHEEPVQSELTALEGPAQPVPEVIARKGHAQPEVSVVSGLALHCAILRAGHLSSRL